MNRRALERHLRSHGCFLNHHGTRQAHAPVPLAHQHQEGNHQGNMQVARDSGAVRDVTIITSVPVFKPHFDIIHRIALETIWAAPDPEAACPTELPQPDGEFLPFRLWPVSSEGNEPDKYEDMESDDLSNGRGILKRAWNRLLNVVVGLVQAGFVTWSLFGEPPWPYYVIFVRVETASFLFITAYAWTWRRESSSRCT